jgi:NAD(P)-dependent dehydrogenase (short-subunit alcohol dehydrogenase family)
MFGRSYEIEGRTVLITGGARGIGGDAARRLVDLGASVALVDVQSDQLEAHAASLGDRALPILADVTDTAAVADAVAQTVKRFGGLDVVVASAGISGPPTTTAAIDPADFERVIEVNLLGVWRTIRAALPHVTERGGYLLPIASLAAAIPAPLISAYAASKHGVEGFARSLRMEVAHTQTKVGVGYFSFIDTDMVRDGLAAIDHTPALSALPTQLARPLPVGAAGKAVVRGIEHRSKYVYAPGWVRAALALRGFGGPLEDLSARLPRFRKALRQLDRETAAPAGDNERALQETAR